MKKIVISASALCMFLTYGKAQSTLPSWNLAGNSNASPASKLGTTNDISVRFYTNNVQRMIINSAAGYVGIGNSSPVNILTVQSSGGTPAASWLSGLNAPVFVGFASGMSSEFLLAGASNAAGERAVYQGRRSRGTLTAPLAVVNNDNITSLLASAYDGKTFQNPALVSFFVDGTPSAGNVPTRISLVTGSNAGNRTERLKVGSTGNFNFNNGQLFLNKATGSLGIGTTSPASALHIISGSYVSLINPGNLMMGDTAGYNMVMDVDVIQARYANTAASLYLNYYGGYTYLGPGGAVAVSSAGALTTGLAGINGSSNASYALNVNASSSYNGINVTDGVDAYSFYTSKSGLQAGVYVTKTSTSSVDACVWGNSAGSARGLQGNSNTGIGLYASTNNSATYAGYFVGNVYTTGTYLPSDLTLKKNVRDFTKAFDLINQLHPKLYEYKDDGDYKLMNLPKGSRYGLIAEDVEKVLPGLVKQTKFETATDEAAMKGVASPAIDFKAVNYTELIPVIIKAMQEQDIDKDKKIDDLQNQVNELKSLVQALTKQGNTTASLSTAFLKQNAPNPFNTNTVISYYIPDNTSNALIKITDVKGSLVKTFKAATGEGHINIRAGELPAGSYNYTLYINNKTLDTKQMVLLK